MRKTIITFGSLLIFSGFAHAGSEIEDTHNENKTIESTTSEAQNNRHRNAIQQKRQNFNKDRRKGAVGIGNFERKQFQKIKNDRRKNVIQQKRQNFNNRK